MEGADPWARACGPSSGALLAAAIFCCWRQARRWPSPASDNSEQPRERPGTRLETALSDGLCVLNTSDDLGRPDELSIAHAERGGVRQGPRRRRQNPGIARWALAQMKRRRAEWEAGEPNQQRGPVVWSLERSFARLTLAKLAHSRLGGESPLIEEDWVRHDLVRRVQRELPACDLAAMLGPQLRQHAALLLEAGYASPPDLWAMVAKTRKQSWLVETGMAGAKLRPTRQGVIDAIVAHRTRYCGDAENEPARKKRNTLQILDEPPLAPVEVASEFPGALVLDGLPLPAWEGPIAEGSQGPAESCSNRPFAVVTERGSRLPVGSELPEAPEGVVLITGGTGSGKTTLLRHWASQLLGLGANASNPRSVRPGLGTSWFGVDDIEQPRIEWDPSKAIISQFGDLSTLTHAGDDHARRSFDEGRHWLSAVGLSSIPCWCMPHHILSTGQAYRATLARQLQAAAAATARAEYPKGIRQPNVLLLDDFATVLDPLTAASVASTLGRTLLRLNMRALITTPQPKLAHWLQPHTIVELSIESKSERRNGVGSTLLLRKNPSPGRPPHVRIHLNPQEMLPQSSCDAENPDYSSAKDPGVDLGLPVSSSVCFSSNTRTSFAANYDKEQRPYGGTVLRTRVQIDTATALCDAVFDRAFDGMVYYRVPDFPTSLMLPGALKVEASSPKKDSSSDSYHGGDQVNLVQQTKKQFVTPAVGRRATHKNGTDNSKYEAYEPESHNEPMSKAQRKKAQKKLARAQAKARAKLKVESAGAASHASSHPQQAPYAHLKATNAPISTPLPRDTSQHIGMIVGPSGCAKSVLLRLYFGWPVDSSTQGMNVWDASASIWSQFPVALHAETAVEEAFESVGLLHRRSPQHSDERLDCSWLKSVQYSELSQGEQYLCNVAYLLIHCQLRRAKTAPTAEQNVADACSVGKQYSENWRGSGVLLLDEFTSCLDRQSARRLGAGLSKYCRKHAEVLPRVVVAGCHRDVIAPDAFVPDWVFEADTMTLHHLDLAAVATLASTVEATSDVHNCSSAECGDRLGADAAPKQELERAHDFFHVPVIKLRLRACSPATWRDFRVHHYKTQTLSLKARTFVLTLESLHYSSDGSTEQHGNTSAPVCGTFEGICSANCPVGFVATIPQSGSGVSDIAPSPSASTEVASTTVIAGSTATAAHADATTSHRRAEAWRAHRTVVLPAWQGLGVGSRLSDAAAALHHREGYDYYGQTVHPRFGAYRDASPLWRPTLWNHSTQRFKIESWKQRTANTRVRLRTPRYVYSHYFVGPTQQADDPANAALAGRVAFDGENELNKGDRAGPQ